MELKCELQKLLQLQIDNRFAINLAKNPVSHGISKKIETKFPFIREQVMSGKIDAVYFSTQAQNLLMILLEALKLDKFEAPREKLGIVSLEVMD
jgi:hypothetical protein